MCGRPFSIRMGACFRRRRIAYRAEEGGLRYAASRQHCPLGPRDPGPAAGDRRSAHCSDARSPLAAAGLCPPSRPGPGVPPVQRFRRLPLLRPDDLFGGHPGHGQYRGCGHRPGGRRTRRAGVDGTLRPLRHGHQLRREPPIRKIPPPGLPGPMDGRPHVSAGGGLRPPAGPKAGCAVRPLCRGSLPGHRQHDPGQRHHPGPYRHLRSAGGPGGTGGGGAGAGRHSGRHPQHLQNHLRPGAGHGGLLPRCGAGGDPGKSLPAAGGTGGHLPLRLLPGRGSGRSGRDVGRRPVGRCPGGVLQRGGAGLRRDRRRLRRDG